MVGHYEWMEHMIFDSILSVPPEIPNGLSSVNDNEQDFETRHVFVYEGRSQKSQPMTPMRWWATTVVGAQLTFVAMMMQGMLMHATTTRVHRMCWLRKKCTEMHEVMPFCRLSTAPSFMMTASTSVMTPIHDRMRADCPLYSGSYGGAYGAPGGAYGG